MGGGKKRSRGGNRFNEEEKRKRREYAENWKKTRGDDVKKDSNQTSGDNKGWQSSLVFENKRFECFYRSQGFLRLEKDNVDDVDTDWDRFLNHLKLPLPACFRISPDYAFSEALKEQLMKYVGQNITVEESGREIAAVEQIKWLPNATAYKLGTDRRSIRKLPILQELHQWMKQHTENGNLTRQEAVSMVPPIALDVHPHHRYKNSKFTNDEYIFRCLDMCASPGSKTSQLLEIINRLISLFTYTLLVSRSLSATDPSQQGLVVANDSDTERAYMY